MTLTLGQRIRALRRERGLAVWELAINAAISPSYLSKVETGHSVPSDVVVGCLETALGVPHGTLPTAQVHSRRNPQAIIDDLRQEVRRLRAEVRAQDRQIARLSRRVGYGRHVAQRDCPENPRPTGEATY